MHHFIHFTAITTLVCLTVFAATRGLLDARIVFSLAAAALLYTLVLLHARKALGTLPTALLGAGLGLAATLRIVSLVIKNGRTPPEWDFLCYWVYSLSVKMGLPFYESRLDLERSLPVVPSATFITELLATPFHFPPPAAFIYSWLHFFTYEQACFIWSLILITALLLSILSLHRTFPQSNISPGFLGLTLLCLGPTYEVFSYCQTGLFLLLCLILFYNHRDSIKGGAILGAAASLLKPIAVILILFPLFRGRILSLLGLALSATALLIFSGVVFGWGNALGYFSSDLPNALPPEMYVQEINQSLLAAVLRLTGHHASPLSSPMFIVLAGTLTLATLVQVTTAHTRSAQDRAFMSVLVLALLCYPGTLTHYSVLLILPIALLLRELPKETGAAYLLLIMSLTAIDSWKTGLLALLFTWGALCLPALDELVRSRRNIANRQSSTAGIT